MLVLLLRDLEALVNPAAVLVVVVDVAVEDVG